MYVYMRASELRKFWHFHILKLLFPSIFLLVLHLPCLKNIFHFRCQITSAYTYTINAVSVYYLWYMVLYKRQYTDKHTHWANVCVCERAERASLENFGLFTFLNCYFFQYFVGTSDTLSVQMTCLSNYNVYIPTNFSNVPTKLRKSIIGGGGGQLPPCPPPSGYANGKNGTNGKRMSCSLQAARPHPNIKMNWL